MADPIDAAIQETMRKLGIEDAALDEQGALTLDLEGAPLLLRRGSEPGEALWIHIGLGDAPERSAAARFLMRAAFEGWSQGRMTVGLDRRSGQAWAGSMLPAAGITADLLDVEAAWRMVQGLPTARLAAAVEETPALLIHSVSLRPQNDRWQMIVSFLRWERPS